MNNPPDQISARIIADSINPAGIRITSFVLVYPRLIHSEFLTHRTISRNAASSRAIPVAKQLVKAHDHPVVPIRYTSTKAGMQGGEPLGDDDERYCREMIESTGRIVAERVACLHEHRLHRQHATRYLEPWLPITTLATATEWTNFFQLRAHHMAQPELQVLAYRMLNQYMISSPDRLKWNEWHMPFGDKMRPTWTKEECLKVATARCARLSYETFDGEFSFEQDVRLHDQLAESKHFSPFEHCARAVYLEDESTGFSRSNFHPSWHQYRKLFQNEHGRSDISLSQILRNKPDWIAL